MPPQPPRRKKVEINVTLRMTVKSDCENREAIIDGLGAYVSEWVRKKWPIATADTIQGEEIVVTDFELTDDDAQVR